MQTDRRNKYKHGKKGDNNRDKNKVMSKDENAKEKKEN